jgi:hypothetical protein
LMQPNTTSKLTEPIKQASSLLSKFHSKLVEIDAVKASSDENKLVT